MSANMASASAARLTRARAVRIAELNAATGRTYRDGDDAIVSLLEEMVMLELARAEDQSRENDSEARRYFQVTLVRQNPSRAVWAAIQGREKR